MDSRRHHEWEQDTQAYSSSQVQAILHECNISIEQENANGFLAFCPFHGNSHDPAFGINHQTGRWSCFNGACSQHGDLYDLLRKIKGLGYFQANRLIKKYEKAVSTTLDELLSEDSVPDFVEFPSEPLLRMHEDLWKSDRAREYLKSRRIRDDAIEYFNIGYSEKRDMIIFPMYCPDGMPVGFVARSLTGKDFRNTVGLPRSKTLWNFQKRMLPQVV